MNVSISNINVKDWAIFVFVTALFWGLGDGISWIILDHIKIFLGLGLG